jgi:hypothetical protein
VSKNAPGTLPVPPWDGASDLGSANVPTDLLARNVWIVLLGFLVRTAPTLVSPASHAAVRDLVLETAPAAAILILQEIHVTNVRTAFTELSARISVTGKRRAIIMAAAAANLNVCASTIELASAA